MQYTYAMAGYSQRSVAEKLGLKPQTTILTLHAPRPYADLISPFPPGIRIKTRLAGGEYPFIHIFAFYNQVLEKEFPVIIEHLAADGMLCQ